MTGQNGDVTCWRQLCVRAAAVSSLIIVRSDRDRIAGADVGGGPVGNDRVYRNKIERHG